MRILQINKFFHVRGGADTFFFKTCHLLQEHGHEVAHFATRHAKNVSSPYEQYFVAGGFTEQDVAQLSFSRKVGAFAEGIYSRPAYRSLRALIDEFGPEIAHVHNINYQLSPSIFDALHDAAVPAVMTLHDYGIICGAGTLFRDGRICELCRGGHHYHCAVHRCFHQHLPASAMAMASMYVHEARGTWHKLARLISPSRFLREKLAEFGVDSGRVTHLPNFVDFERTTAAAPAAGSYVLYFGRFSQNKGVMTLIEACKPLDVPVLIVGDGPLRPDLESACAGLSRLVMKPFVTARDEMKAIIAASAFVVVPSTWYENQPTTILEAYAMGKPVIASRLGGIPELVDEGQTGLRFEPGNADELRQKISFLIKRPELWQAWGAAGRHKLIAQFSSATHYSGLKAIYEAVLGRASSEAEAIPLAAGSVVE